MVFWAFGSEVPTDGIIAALAERGTMVALPKIVGQELQVRAYLPGDPVNETSFGAREPAAGDVLDPQEIDVVLVPGVAFDRAGYRIGYGRGFYDRFLREARPSAERVSVAFALQLVDSVPRGAFDLPVDTIVTELETVRTEARTAPGDDRSARRDPKS
jgi:5-formyltetrahydrofolate cyclo-ligase